MKAHGKCLCGSVTLEVEYASNELAACHCRMCRNWSGGPMLALDCKDAVKISGDANVTRYASSENPGYDRRRSFCPLFTKWLTVTKSAYVTSEW